MVSLEKRIEKGEQAAARKRAARYLEEFQRAFATMTDEECASWWYGMMQDSDAALCGRHEEVGEPGALGVRRWVETGAMQALKNLCDLYDRGGPLPFSECPSSVDLQGDRRDGILSAARSLREKYREPEDRRESNV